MKVNTTKFWVLTLAICWVTTAFFVTCTTVSESKSSNGKEDQNRENIPEGDLITFDESQTFQTVVGWGGGIKRKTEELYAMDGDVRRQIEKLVFRGLDVNMIRLFVYDSIEPQNDNGDPEVLDKSKLDFEIYRRKKIDKALQRAQELTGGLDHIIGNCNSPAGWLKENGTAKGGPLIDEPWAEDEYSEFLIGFLEGMKEEFDVEVTALSPSNEPDWEVTYRSMDLTPQELSEIVYNLGKRLSAEGRENIDLITPEGFRIDQVTNPDRGTSLYVNEMFKDVEVKQMVDVVATHTYANKNFTANWEELKTAGQDKPVWVTESAILDHQSNSMSDAKFLTKWIINGFSKGGLRAYMTHVIYELLDIDYEENTFEIPKRYYTFKQFANYVKPGYKRISISMTQENTSGIAFISPEGDKIVLEIFHEGAETTRIPIAIPDGVKSLDHIVTSDNENHNASKVDDVKFTSGDNKIKVDIQSQSLHTIVLNL